MIKKLTLIFFFVGLCGMAQTDGLSYQSVIIDPDAQEIPGVDKTGNVLNNQNIEVRFTILNETGSAEYREVQATKTDAFGMIHLVIGRGEPDFGDFSKIVWDGTAKQLKVEANLGNGFRFQEEKELLFIPYAFHRDIIVTKDLNVAGDVTIEGNLDVALKTDLNNNLFVNEQATTDLSGLLSVDGITTLQDSLTVANASPTGLRGTLAVEGTTLLKDSLFVGRRTRMDAILEVEGTTEIGNGLNVENGSPTLLTGSLNVDGETNILNDVNVNNESDVTVSGDLTVQGPTTLEQDLDVNGVTNFNNTVNVNNQSPTMLSGILIANGPSRLENTLVVTGATDLDGGLNVNGQNPTQLSGTLSVGQETNLNNPLFVNNETPTDFSGDLTVGGEATFNNDVTINGVTNLNNNLFVNNGSPTNLSGTLTTDRETTLNDVLDVTGAVSLNNNLTVGGNSSSQLSGTMTVDEATSLNNTLTVANASATTLSGTITVDGATTLGDDMSLVGGNPSSLTGTLNVGGKTGLGDGLSVLNGKATALSGTLTTSGAATLESTLRVNNNAATSFSGIMDVDGTTNLANTLDVLNGSATNLSGILNVTRATTFNSIVAIDGLSLIQNDLTVTGAANLPSIFTAKLTINDNQAGHIGVFENTNSDTDAATRGDGILIKLGRTHGAYNGPEGTNNASDYLNVTNPYLAQYQPQIDVVQSLIATTNPGGASINVNDIVALIPTNLVAGQFGAIGNSIIDVINDKLGLPVSTPEIAVPATTIVPEVTIFSGTNRLCSGQYCFNPCTFFNCTICIPPVEFCVPPLPRIYIPAIRVPRTVLVPSISNIIPAIPAAIPEIGVADALLTLPNVTFGTVSNSMSKENQFLSFQDMADRETGSVVAQSTADFLDNTVLDQTYVINVVAGFVGVDLVEGLVGAGVEMSNLIDAFNKIGVSYESGNGDYAEWLPRADVSEYITAGDIVAVRGGEISKNLENAEQVLVVSHKPIVLGNNPDNAEVPKGNSVAFLGQVPVKVIGPVKQGDFIVTDTKMAGYGKAISEKNMRPEDFKLAVGRSWETNANGGPKLVKIVMGVHNASWADAVASIETQQNQLDATIETLEEKLQRISEKLNTESSKEVDYASNLKK
jgi:hypothetical protein